MPELPEVETVCRALRKLVLGKRVIEYCLMRPEYLRVGEDLIPQTRGDIIQDIQRKGKIIAIHLGNGVSMLHHLGMSGRLIYVESEHPIESHTHVRILFDKGIGELRQRDPRRFGYVGLCLTSEMENFTPWKTMGEDPFKISPKHFCERLRGRARAIKTLLLDQRVLGGMGNIYADEALFRAGIMPTRPAGDVNPQEARILLKQIRQVLNESIAAGGSSTSDFQKLDGTLGEFQMRHRVYQRDGLPCKNCGGLLAKKSLGGRSSHYCPRCQS